MLRRSCHGELVSYKEGHFGENSDLKLDVAHWPIDLALLWLSIRAFLQNNQDFKKAALRRLTLGYLRLYTSDDLLKKVKGVGLDVHSFFGFAARKLKSTCSFQPAEAADTWGTSEINGHSSELLHSVGWMSLNADVCWCHSTFQWLSPLCTRKPFLCCNRLHAGFVTAAGVICEKDRRPFLIEFISPKTKHTWFPSIISEHEITYYFLMIVCFLHSVQFPVSVQYYHKLHTNVQDYAGSR